MWGVGRHSAVLPPSHSSGHTWPHHPLAPPHTSWPSLKPPLPPPPNVGETAPALPRLSHLAESHAPSSSLPGHLPHLPHLAEPHAPATSPPRERQPPALPRPASPTWLSLRRVLLG